jgi:hypothetical protein
VDSTRVWNGDESYDLTAGKCQYFVGLTRPRGDPDDTRAALRGRVLRPGGVLHFYDEGADRQMTLVEGVRELGFDMIVIRWTGAAAAARARTRCLIAAATALHGSAAGLVLESIGPKSDARDRRALSRLHPAAYQLPVRFVDKRSEPLVWASDIVAGAALQAFARGRSHYLDALGGVRLIDAQ